MSSAMSTIGLLGLTVHNTGNSQTLKEAPEGSVFMVLARGLRVELWRRASHLPTDKRVSFQRLNDWKFFEIKHILAFKRFDMPDPLAGVL